MKLYAFNKRSIVLTSLFFSLLLSLPSSGQTPISDYFPDIIIRESNNPAPGYFFLAAKGLTAPGASLYIAIVDNYGTPVFFRKMNKASGYLRLLPDGRIGNMNGVPRKLNILNDMLEIETTYSIEGFGSNGHDWASDAEGNILLMGEAISYKDMSALIEGGNENAEVLDLIVQEFDNQGNLKYTWNSADHFDIFDGNENSPFLDYTEAQLDYVHANSITIDSDTSFLISCRHMDQITKVDRRSGEIIWNLGGKKNDFTFINDPLGFSHQHSISILDNGDLLLFDNGNLHEEQISTSVVYRLDQANKTATLIERIGRTPAVYCNHGSGTQRVYNGNTINFWGTYWPSATEFHPDGTVALEIDFTHHSFSPGIFKFLWETKVFETDKDSVDFGQVETQAALFSEISVTNNKADELILNGFSAHEDNFDISTDFPINIPAGESKTITIRFKGDEVDKGVYDDVITLFSDTEDQRIARQIWVFAEKTNELTDVSDINLNKETFVLSPIPASSTLQIQTNSNTAKRFEIFNLNGKSIYAGPVFKTMDYSVDIRFLNKGIYFLVLSNLDDNTRKTKKFIVNY